MVTWTQHDVDRVSDVTTWTESLTTWPRGETSGLSCLIAFQGPLVGTSE